LEEIRIYNMAITRAQQARQMLKKGSEPVVQGGVDNYLGKQPQVVAPRKWQSGPDKPPTELAYITEAEKKLLLKEDIHGSLKEGPNKGPAGIMSLDSFGDIGGGGSAGVDTSPGGGASGDDKTQFSGQTVAEMNMKNQREKEKAIERRKANERAVLQIAERKQAKDLGYDERENIADYGSADDLQRLYTTGVPKTNVPFLNLTEGPRNYTLRKNIDYYRYDPRTRKAREKYGLTAQGYKDYMTARLAGEIDAAGNIIYSQDDDDPIIFPQDMEDNTGGGGDGGDNTEDDDDTNTGGLALRFRKDGGRINAMDGGMMSPVGGIMDLESGRQMYFLGKLVKKATRAVKKIAKSPIGKAALLYFGGQALAGKMGGLGGLKSKLFGTAMKPGFAGPGIPGLFTKLGLTKTAGSMMPTPMGGIALASLAPFLFQGEEEEEDQTTDRGPGLDIRKIRENPYDFLGPNFADGGRIGYQEGSKEPVAKKTMPLLDMGGKEMDLREDGGFVPIGRMERADDVPARLSKNEFVFTADAVRNAGDGDVDKGAEVMYNMMKNLESGGDVSEESQGLQGAREMFQTSKRLEEVL